MFRMFVAFVVSIGIHACALGKMADQPEPGQDPNTSPVYRALDNLTTAIFDHEQPALNEAISQLPPDAQVLVQAAYVALEQAIDAAAAYGFRGRALDPNTSSRLIPGQSATEDLNAIAGILHQAIHDPNAPSIAVSAPQGPAPDSAEPAAR